MHRFMGCPPSGIGGASSCRGSSWSLPSSAISRREGVCFVHSHFDSAESSHDSGEIGLGTESLSCPRSFTSFPQSSIMRLSKMEEGDL